MKAYRNERIENAIAFFAGEHYKKTSHFLYQTSMWKYLSFFEFRRLEQTGEMPLELSYCAMEHGPVPIELYHNISNLKSDLYRVIQEDQNKYKFQATGRPNLDYFSEDEIAELNNLIFMFAQKWVQTKIMSDSSHQAIKPWIATWKTNPNSLIDPILQFSDIKTKTEDELSAIEEHFLTWQTKKLAACP